MLSPIRVASKKVKNALESLCCQATVFALTFLYILAVSGRMIMEYGVLDVVKSALTPGMKNITMMTEVIVDMEEDGIQLTTIFHYISFLIASLFFIEMILKLLVFRFQLLKHCCLVIDMLLVVSAAAIEFTSEIFGLKSQALDTCKLVMALRLCCLPYSLKCEQFRPDLSKTKQTVTGQIPCEENCCCFKNLLEHQLNRIDRLEKEVDILTTNYFSGPHVAPVREDSTHKHRLSYIGASRKCVNNRPAGNLSPSASNCSNRFLTSASSLAFDSPPKGSRVTDGEYVYTLNTELGGLLSRQADLLSYSNVSLSCQTLSDGGFPQPQQQTDSTVACNKFSHGRCVWTGKMKNIPIPVVKCHRDATKRLHLSDGPPGSPACHDNYFFRSRVDKNQQKIPEVEIYTYRNADGIPMTDL